MKPPKTLKELNATMHRLKKSVMPLVYPKLLKRYRKMRIGETRQRGDQCLYLGKWFDIFGTVGRTIRPGDAGRFRTKRRLPKFYAK